MTVHDIISLLSSVLTVISIMVTLYLSCVLSIHDIISLLSIVITIACSMATLHLLYHRK